MELMMEAVRREIVGGMIEPAGRTRLGSRLHGCSLTDKFPKFRRFGGQVFRAGVPPADHRD